MEQISGVTTDSRNLTWYHHTDKTWILLKSRHMWKRMDSVIRQVITKYAFKQTKNFNSKIFSFFASSTPKIKEIWDIKTYMPVKSTRPCQSRIKNVRQICCGHQDYSLWMIKLHKFFFEKKQRLVENIADKTHS